VSERCLFLGVNHLILNLMWPVHGSRLPLVVMFNKESQGVCILECCVMAGSKIS
jgi:hypothetical protein